MAFDAELADEMRKALIATLGTKASGLAERRMMGSHCFMLRGNMVSAANRDSSGQRRFMFRVGKDNHAAADLPGGELVVMGERVMRGFYLVDADGCDARLRDRWLQAAIGHALSLPAK